MNLEFWSKFSGWGSSLFGNIDFKIDAHLVDFNISRSSDGDPVGVGEISGQVSGNTCSNEFGSVGGVVSVELDVTDWWLWKSDSDVLEESSIEINLWDLDVFDDVEDVWDSNVLGVVDSFLGDGDGDTWTGSGGSTDECAKFVEHIEYKIVMIINKNSPFINQMLVIEYRNYSISRNTQVIIFICM